MCAGLSSAIEAADAADESSGSALTCGDNLGGNLAKGLRQRRKAPADGPAEAGGGGGLSEDVPSALGAEGVMVRFELHNAHHKVEVLSI